MTNSHQLNFRVGPAGYAARMDIARGWPVFARLYELYPPADVIDYAVKVAPPSLARRFFRPQAQMFADYILTDALPLPASQAQVMMEMALNLQMALGYRRHLVLHASGLARHGRAVICTAQSGSGKSTLAAALGYRGDWRFLGDEFVLLDPVSGAALPYPRPVSLKNESIAVLRDLAGADRLVGDFAETPKGRISYLLPPESAVRLMDETADPALLLMPQYAADAAPKAERMPVADVFAQMVLACPNYRMLGEAGFQKLAALAEVLPGYRIAYASIDDASRLVEQLWGQHVPA